MKRIIAFIIMLGLVAAPLSASAHPGRTDTNGGHTCRTNCAKWGLKDGEYHYHNDGSSSGGSSTSSKSTTNKTNTTPTKTSQPKKSAEAAEEISTTTKNLIIAVDKTNVFSSASANSKVKDQLKYGEDIVEVLGRTGSFLQISYFNKNEQLANGYIHVNATYSYPTMDYMIVKTQPKVGYVFSTPSPKSKVRFSLPQSSLLIALGQTKDWYYIARVLENGEWETGFISKSVAKPTNPIFDLHWVIFTNVFEYQGEKNSQGKPHGKGKYFDSSGELVYEGEFKDGKMNGYGRFVGDAYNKLGDVDQIIYTGSFKNDNFHGKGSLKIAHSSYYGTKPSKSVIYTQKEFIGNFFNGYYIGK